MDNHRSNFYDDGRESFTAYLICIKPMAITEMHAYSDPGPSRPKRDKGKGKADANDLAGILDFCARIYETLL